MRTVSSLAGSIQNGGLDQGRSGTGLIDNQEHYQLCYESKNFAGRTHPVPASPVNIGGKWKRGLELNQDEKVYETSRLLAPRSENVMAKLAEVAIDYLSLL